MAAGIKASADGLYGTLQVNSADVVTFNDSGNVGIGTLTPTARLQLSSTGNPGLVFDGTNQAADLKRIRLVTQIAAAGDFAIQSMNDAGSVKSTNLYIDASANLKFNSGYGSAATAYGCRAWVNFNGTGTVAIRASGNVSSITDNATGDYTVNFTTAMPDANYSAAGTAGTGGTANASILSGPNNQVPAVGSFRVLTLNATVATDYAYVSLSFFR